MSRIIYLLLICLNLIFLTVGCDGSGSSSDNSEYVSGVAATGAAAANTLVTLTDANGEVKSTISGTDGSYSIEVTGMTAPYVIWFETGGKTIYATDCGSDKVNVTPLSDVVTRAVYQQAGGSGNPDASMIPEGECTTVQDQIKEIIEPVLELYGLDKDTDFISQADFSADTFGLDGIFDDYNMEINEEGSFVFSSKIDNTPIVSVSVEELESPDESIEEEDVTETVILRMLNHIAEETDFESFGGDINIGASAVSSDLNLFITTHNGVSASWSSSNTALIANDGTVTVPDSSAEVTLTLTLNKNGYSVTREFELIVQNIDGDVAADYTALTFDSIKGSNTSDDSVSTDLTLPSSGTNGTTISWDSSDTNYISDSGEVTTPAAADGDQSVTLTATISKGSSEQEKEFDFTVVVSDDDAVEAAVADLTFDSFKGNNASLTTIKTDLSLPDSGSNGTEITWVSNNTTYLANDGTVTRPTDADQSVTLTATITKDSVNTTKDFNLTVKVYTFTLVSPGFYHTLAIREDGTLWAWGLNSDGQLGVNDTNDKTSPTQVGTASNWVAVTSGDSHSLAVNSNGELYTWGSNSNGQLGNENTGTNELAPARIGSASNWASVASGSNHSLAINTDGELYAWGSNGSGELGLNDNADRDAPAIVGGASNWNSVAARGSFTLALNTDGEIYSWGENGNGQLGLGGIGNTNTPGKVTASNWESIAAGSNHSLAINTNGELYSWGKNSDGQLGLGNTNEEHSPTKVDGASNWASISAGSVHSLAVNTNGELYAWGDNGSSQLGFDSSGSDVDSPTLVGTNWESVSAGGEHSVAISSVGFVWTWGLNWFGQIGNGTTDDQAVPLQVAPAP